MARFIDTWQPNGNIKDSGVVAFCNVVILIKIITLISIIKNFNLTRKSMLKNDNFIWINT